MCLYTCFCSSVPGQQFPPLSKRGLGPGLKDSAEPLTPQVDLKRLKLRPSPLPGVTPSTPGKDEVPLGQLQTSSQGSHAVQRAWGKQAGPGCGNP